MITMTGFFDELVKIAKKGAFARLKDNKVQLDPDERAKVIKAKAVWHNGPNNSVVPAVWKSVDKNGKKTYVTNTHRAYNVAPTVQGAIGRYHKFIKGTA